MFFVPAPESNRGKAVAGFFTTFTVSLINCSNMDNEKTQELEAMLVHLSKRIEKLEGRSRMAPWSTYLKELKNEASKILQFWN